MDTIIINNTTVDKSNKTKCPESSIFTLPAHNCTYGGFARADTAPPSTTVTR